MFALSRCQQSRHPDQIVRRHRESELERDTANAPVFGLVQPGDGLGPGKALLDCQSARKFDPRSASNFDPLVRRARAIALVPSELVGIAEAARARLVG